MNIAIDIDDTLTNSFDYFQPFVAEFFGVDLSELKEKGISYGNLPNEWKPRELEFFRAYYDKVVPQTTFKSDAADCVRKLRERGHKVIIITARTNSFYTDAYKTTVEELKNGNIVYDKLVCSMDKAAACVENRIDVLFDDMLYNVDAAIDAGVNAVLFTSKANVNADKKYKRVNDWSEVLRFIDEIEKQIESSEE